MIDKHFKYVILGAGCAGLSLCHALLAQGVTDPILILDSKPAFANDRTWCFWSVRPNPFSSLASHCWHQWEVIDASGHPASQISTSIGYFCLHGIDFYAHILDVIRRHPTVSLQLNCSVVSCRTHKSGISVRTADGEAFNAEYGFDSRSRPCLHHEKKFEKKFEKKNAIAFDQRFFGQFVRAEEPLFYPSKCTLMDYRVSQEQGLHFAYVLPFSPVEALIENTYIEKAGENQLTSEQHRTEIRNYLRQHYGLHTFDVLREEAGTIPMTPRPFPKRKGRIFFIGTAGGCTKPSSGYTFQRIQEQARQMAVAAAAGTLASFREKPPPFRFRYFDTVFLQAMHDRPEAFLGYFQRLFARVPPEALASFLSETSTWRSDLRILSSLPLSPFLQAALRSLPRLFSNG